MRIPGRMLRVRAYSQAKKNPEMQAPTTCAGLMWMMPNTRPETSMAVVGLYRFNNSRVSTPRKNTSSTTGPSTAMQSTPNQPV